MNELNQYIKSYFGVVDNHEIKTIVSLFEQRSISKGVFLLKAGHYSDQLVFIQSGLMRMFLDNDKKEITQWIATPGYFCVDLSSFIFEIPARLSIQALSDCQVYAISKNDYKRIGSLVHHWHELEKMFLVRCFVTLEERIISHLSMSAEERYLAFFDQNKALFNQVPLQYIASMLGMTPETFSRIRKKHLN